MLAHVERLDRTAKTGGVVTAGCLAQRGDGAHQAIAAPRATPDSRDQRETLGLKAGRARKASRGLEAGPVAVAAVL